MKVGYFLAHPVIAQKLQNLYEDCQCQNIKGEVFLQCRNSPTLKSALLHDKQYHAFSESTLL